MWILAPVNISAVPKVDLSIPVLLQKRAELFAQIRSFFLQRGVMEVEAPLICRAATTDLHIESIPVMVEQFGISSERYLITSPEFYLKRLLVEGCPSVFYLGKVFRQGDHGRRHHHEFSMLEWYRLQWDEHCLMDEVAELLSVFLPDRAHTRVSYGELFFSAVGVNPYQSTLQELKACIATRIDINLDMLTLNDCLELLFTHCIEPDLQGITFVYDYPVSMAALAQTGFNVRGEPIARRFEVFVNDLELGNGYFELTDAQEQRLRFQQDLLSRAALARKDYPQDEGLLAALEKGLPECAGVALGIDRLLMAMLGAESLAELTPFLTEI